MVCFGCMEPTENGTKPIKDEKGRFVQGNPGGPGRPPGSLSLVGLLKKKLEEIPDGEQKTWAELFIEKTLNDSYKGDPTSKKLVWNYVEGLPHERIDVTSGGKPIPLFGNVPTDESNQEDTKLDEAN